MPPKCLVSSRDCVALYFGTNSYREFGFILPGCWQRLLTKRESNHQSKQYFFFFECSGKYFCPFEETVILCLEKFYRVQRTINVKCNMKLFSLLLNSCFTDSHCHVCLPGVGLSSKSVVLHTKQLPWKPGKSHFCLTWEWVTFIHVELFIQQYGWGFFLLVMRLVI